MSNPIKMPIINDNATREEMLALLTEADICNDEAERMEAESKAHGIVGLMSYAKSRTNAA
ncbi:MAG: hypothetical protein IJ849_06255 [Selenomonadaceae bacterium]|nr:hypothetical protein [Selenomonadaceae bacterium]